MDMKTFKVKLVDVIAFIGELLLILAIFAMCFLVA